MKWYISLITLFIALTTAFPTIGRAISSRDDHEATFAYDKRGGCSDGDTGKGSDCCCACAMADAWPCIGCITVSNCTV